MEYRILGNTGLNASVVGLGTWVMGGWLWGGADRNDSLCAIREALDLGVNLIDTAPIYGHGLAEELVGEALQAWGHRDRVIIATKVGLEWDESKTHVWRNSQPVRIQQELQASLRRLRTDYIDIYQVHWPDQRVPFEDTMEALLALQRQGTIRFIGVSNFSVPQLERCLNVGLVHVHQPPYNLFERDIEQNVLPFCRTHNIGTLIYGPLCRGLLSGKYRGTETFEASETGDIRAMDPKFSGTRFAEYVTCVDRLKTLAMQRGCTIGQLAIRWCLDQPGVSVALCGARTSQHIREHAGATGWSLSSEDLSHIRQMISETITVSIGPEFMAPAS